MLDLVSFPARICFTSAAFLVYQSQVLVVKHKKLGIWLVPGGHFETDELPHQAAERECLEETGIRVKANASFTTLTNHNSQYLPVPFAINLHWISEENYAVRLHSKNPDIPHSTEKWPRGCEQHCVFCFLVQPIGAVTVTQNKSETEGIKWVAENEVDALESTQDIKQELKFVLHA